MHHRVVVTGVGCVTPYGVGVKALWNGLQSGKSALTFCPKLGVVVGRIPRPSESENGFNVDEFSQREQREMSFPSILSLKAADETLRDAGLLDVDPNFHRETGTNIGMGIADLQEICRVGRLIDEGKSRQVGPFFVPRILTNIPAAYVALKYGFRGGNSSSTTACATGASCIAEAFAHIQSGRVRRVLAGSVESALNSVAVVGFQRMRALASANEHIKQDDVSISRPFDVHRNGFVISEGVGMLMLERLEDAEKRNANIYAEILGYGLSNDAHHLTAPKADGQASESCMRRCLSDARLKPADVGYVNAHATSTKVGDAAEAAAVHRLFADGVALSSSKGHLGHCVSAAGSIEAIVTLLALQRRCIPPTLNLHHADVPAAVDLVKEEWRSWSATQRRVALKNSFGFGGAFVSIALAEPL